MSPGCEALQRSPRASELHRFSHAAYAGIEAFDRKALDIGRIDLVGHLERTMPD